MAQVTQLCRWMLGSSVVKCSRLDWACMVSNSDGACTRLYASIASHQQSCSSSSSSQSQDVDLLPCGNPAQCPNPYQAREAVCSRLQARLGSSTSRSSLMFPSILANQSLQPSTRSPCSWHIRTLHTGLALQAQDKSHLLEVNKHAKQVAGSITRPAAAPTVRGVPRVLLQDPWPASGTRQQKAQALRACLDVLRAAGPDAALLAEQVHEQVCLDFLQPWGKIGTQVHIGTAVSAQHHGLLTSPAETRALLEHLRDKRLVFGRTHLQAEVPAGHPNYPYLYTALPYQKMFKGSPMAEAKRVAALQQKRMASALRKLRSGKTPFAIHRQVARSSIYQQALAYEQARQKQHLLTTQVPSYT